MNAEELKAASLKTVKGPVSGLEVTIRKLTFFEVTEANIVGLLSIDHPDLKKPLNENQNGPTLEQFVTEQRVKLIGLRTVLERGFIEPKICFNAEKGEPVPDGYVDATWIAEDLEYFAEQISLHSGVRNPEAEAKIDVLIKNGLSPASPTI